MVMYGYERELKEWGCILSSLFALFGKVIAEN
jgi:hypothetical protein